MSELLFLFIGIAVGVIATTVLFAWGDSKVEAMWDASDITVTPAEEWHHFQYSEDDGRTWKDVADPASYDGALRIRTAPYDQENEG